MLSFLMNLSITLLPAEKLNELYAAFLTEFVYYSLKVFYGQEPPSGESTTTECGVNY